ncbi:hypothetical protein FQR65_LT02610 [Abscondita terminalis]|nr:hypothetical protein FQR65_LT02610 [Abscondita terminalis]
MFGRNGNEYGDSLFGGNFKLLNQQNFSTKISDPLHTYPKNTDFSIGDVQSLNNQQKPGTLVKYDPLIEKVGFSSTLAERFNCLNCMNAYNNKSLEELRWEDYQYNRKQAAPASPQTIPLTQLSPIPTQSSIFSLPKSSNDFTNYQNIPRPSTDAPQLSFSKSTTHAVENTTAPKRKCESFCGFPSTIKSDPPQTTNFNPISPPVTPNQNLTQYYVEQKQSTLPTVTNALPSDEFADYVKKIFQPFPRRNYFVKSNLQNRTTDSIQINLILNEMKSAEISKLNKMKLRTSVEDEKDDYKSFLQKNPNSYENEEVKNNDCAGDHSDDKSKARRCLNFNQAKPNSIDTATQSSTASQTTESRVIDKEIQVDQDERGLPHNKPCKLTKSGYYTEPPFNKLHEFVKDDCSCVVDDFVIGRKGYGKIHFLKAVNLFDLNLDKIVDIDYRSVTVYPDDGEKPEIGHGLNVEAEITIDKVWLFDKNSQTVLKDAEKIVKTNFICRLKVLALKQNAEFVNYLPESGSWIFKVKHF